MRRPGFPESVAVAAIAAMSGGLFGSVLEPLLGARPGASLLLTLLGSGYLLYLFTRSARKRGRLSVLAAWISVAIACWVFPVPLLLQSTIQVLFLWLARSLYFHSGAWQALLDLLIQGGSLVAAFWTFMQTGSPALSIWSFFLMQALFVFIPDRRAAPHPPAIPGSHNNRRFLHAHRVAEDAIRKLSANV